MLQFEVPQGALFSAKIPSKMLEYAFKACNYTVDVKQRQNRHEILSWKMFSVNP